MRCVIDLNINKDSKVFCLRRRIYTHITYQDNIIFTIHTIYQVSNVVPDYSIASSSNTSSRSTTKCSILSSFSSRPSASTTSALTSPVSPFLGRLRHLPIVDVVEWRASFASDFPLSFFNLFSLLKIFLICCSLQESLAVQSCATSGLLCSAISAVAGEYFDPLASPSKN